MTDTLLRPLLTAFPSLTVGVIGDFCLDYYLTIDPEGSEVSIETGLMTRAVREARFSAGGAGNVVANLAALGVGAVAAFGIVGGDPFGATLVDLLASAGADTSGLLVQRRDWHTNVYTKLYEGEREHERVDYGNFNAPSGESTLALLRGLEARLPSLDAVVINQQVRAGIHSAELRKGLAGLVARFPGTVFVVDSRSYSDDFPLACHKLNGREAARSCGVEPQPGEPVGREAAVRAAKELSARWGRPVFISRGEDGCLVGDGGEVFDVPGVAVRGPTDPVGAGDALLAGIAASLAAGASAREAASLGNLAAAVTVTKLFRTGTASPDEVLALAAEADYRYRPELAASPLAARFLPGSDIEVVTAVRTGAPPRFAVFDNDGTISTLREGWESIMEPMMIEAVLGGERSAAGRERVGREVKELIERTTGSQTIVQMQELVELVLRHGVVAPQDVLTPGGYKRLYLDRLMKVVGRRLARLASGELDRTDFLVKGAEAFLEGLARRGVRLYLASGTDREDVLAEATALGYARLFEDRIYGSIGEVARDPKREVLKTILAEIGDGAGLVTFGDGPVEMRETRRAGGYAVGIASDEVRRWGPSPAKRARLVLAGADLLAPDFTQAGRLLEALALDRERVEAP